MRLLLALCLTKRLFSAELPQSLVAAAKAQDRAQVRALLQQKADPNSAAPDGTTALHYAAYRDDAEMAGLLLRAGANPNAQNDLGATPLWLASQNGSASLAKLLLDAGANPNLTLLAGESPLMVAARGGYAEVAELLLQKKADPNARGTRGQTALMWAAAQKHPETVKVLLVHGADLNLKSDVWTDVMAVPPHGYLPYNRAIPHGGDTALLFAARNGDLEATKLLLAAGANVNDADAWGVTAVSYAAHSGFREIVQFLLEKGANPNLAESGFAPLHEAVMRRDEKMVAALLEHGADPNLTLKTWTPTRRSSEDWHFEPSLVGATPLWLAARFTEPQVIRLLLNKGADPKFTLQSNYTAEQGFGAVQRKETASTVMAALGALRVSPWTEIPRAERESLALETVKLLLTLGVDLNVHNTDGRTALDLARGLRYEKVAALLEENGAKPGAGAPAGRQRP